jgi:hypothetical protein
VRVVVKVVVSVVVFAGDWERMTRTMVEDIRIAETTIPPAM